ncbi:MAG: tol-pal system-associated acyl-CoA thioesterase [Pseudomonadota bacterium]|nr:tol-pal system-associated acyl-CoA thioesterase [Pseudomonadota bacterium]
MSFRWPVRVYFEDTDAGGIVYYANYFRFLERARTEWLRALGYSQESLRSDDILFVVREVRARYLRPARLDDELTLTVRVESSRKASLVLAQEVLRRNEQGEEECLVQADISIACMNHGGRPQGIPAVILNAMTSSADGQAG